MSLPIKEKKMRWDENDDDDDYDDNRNDEDVTDDDCNVGLQNSDAL